jgi:hypothetical protein
MTAQASTSGTSIDFTSIPSWVKRITVMFSSVSTNGSSKIVVRLGSSSGIVSTSYLCGVGAAVGGSANETSGFPISVDQGAGSVYQGSIVITNISGNTWVANGVFGRSDNTNAYYVGGSSPALAAILNQVRITTVNGTDTFDAGTINILYE